MSDTSNEAVERLAWGLGQRVEFINKGHGNVGEYLDPLFEKAAAALRALLAERDMWRNENAKKQAACEQMGARITALEAERDRLIDLAYIAIEYARKQAYADARGHIEAAAECAPFVERFKKAARATLGEDRA
jgi:hypothetical protein